MSCYIKYTLKKSKYVKSVFQIKITAMLLFSNSIQINISTVFSKKKKKREKKKQPVTEAKAFKFAFWVYNRNPSPCIL